jgi:hypothetical protein
MTEDFASVIDNPVIRCGSHIAAAEWMGGNEIFSGAPTRRNDGMSPSCCTKSFMHRYNCLDDGARSLDVPIKKKVPRSK